MIANISYDQKTLSIFWKHLVTKSKWHQIKIILKKSNLYFTRKKWDFSSENLWLCFFFRWPEDRPFLWYWKENKKMGEYAKIMIFHENWLHQNQRPIGRYKTVLRDKMQFNRWGIWLVYRDANLRNPLSLKKTNNFIIHSQNKIRLEEIDSLSYNFLEN